MRNFQKLDDVISLEAAGWKEDGVKTVLISVLGGDCIDQEGASDDFAHHGDRARWIFTMAGLSEKTTELVGAGTSCDIVIVPENLSRACSADLTTMFGEPVTMQQQASRISSIGNTPAVISSVCAVCWNEVVHFEPTPKEFDGWRLPGKLPTDAKIPMVGTRCVGALTARLFNERTLDAEETELLKVLRLRHEESGEERFCSRDFFLQQFGFDRTPLVSFLRNKLPCHEMITKTTGLPASGRFATPCGSARLCLNCEMVVKSLDAGYRLDLVVNATLACLCKALNSWKRGHLQGGLVSYKCKGTTPQAWGRLCP